MRSRHQAELPTVRKIADEFQSSILEPVGFIDNQQLDQGRIAVRHQKLALARIQATNRPLYRAYLLKEQLRALYELPDPAEAPAHLDAWLAWTARCKLEPFIKLARTLNTRLPSRKSRLAGWTWSASKGVAAETQSLAISASIA